MLFPEKTYLLKQTQLKTKFVNQKTISTEARKELQLNVDRLILTNILRQDTLHIAKGITFPEIYVFEYYLTDNAVTLSESFFKEIESVLPKYIIHILRKHNEAQIVAGYKEKTTNEKIKVVKLYRTQWKSYDELKINLVGLNIDSVYTGILEQIAEGKVVLSSEVTLKEAVEKQIVNEKLEKKISQLKNKIKNEKQFNKQLKLKEELKELLTKLNSIRQ